MKPIERIFAQWAIGSGGDLTKRMIQWMKPDTGWRGFVDSYVNPILSQGIKKVWLHSPFGREGMRMLTFSDGVKGESNYRFDEYLCSKHAGLEWNYDGFVDAIKPLTQQGIEVCCYLGTLDGTFEFEDRNKYAQRKFYQRLIDSLAPVLDSGCSLAIDSSCRAAEGSFTHMFMGLLKARALQVYIEAAPTLKQPHFFNWDMICTNEHWPNVVNPINSNIYPKVDQLTGKIVRMFGGKPAQYATVKDWYMDLIPSILNENPQFMVSANLTHFLTSGGKLTELIAKIGG